MLGKTIVISMAAVWVVVAGSQVRGQSARLTLIGEPGNLYFSEPTLDLTYRPGPQVNFFGGVVTQALPDGTPDWVSLGFERNTQFDDVVFLDFSTVQLGVPLTAGTTYTDVRRAGYETPPGHAGVQFGFRSAECNEVTGSFTVDAIDVAPDSFSASGLRLIAFAAHFEVHCDGITPGVMGTITYKLPEPDTATLTGCVAVLRPLLRRRSACHTERWRKRRFVKKCQSG